jgi:hypothetical protein
MQVVTCFVVVLVSFEIICRFQRKIHANPSKRDMEIYFSGLSYNKNPNWMVGHIPFRVRKNTFETRKYSSGLYVKPFDKIYIHACRNPRLTVKIIFSEHEVFKVVVMVTR